MINSEINFDNFINEFYLNTKKIKMVLQVDIVNSETSIYDIHCMLLDLLVTGIQRFNLDFYNNLEESISNLQYFFNNINIQLNITCFTKKELIIENSSYNNRFVKFENQQKFLINSQHKQVENLEDINSFYLINDDINICINFENKIIQ
jgi:hypothetical protein